jgi:hypothetical protein
VTFFVHNYYAVWKPLGIGPADPKHEESMGHFNGLSKQRNDMNIWESMYIQAYGHHGLLIAEQNNADHNHLFNLARLPIHTDTVAVTHKPTTENHSPPTTNTRYNKHVMR